MVSKFLTYFVAIALTAWFVPDVHFTGWLPLVLTAALLALINTFLRPVITFLSLPLVILTGGLFLIVINALTILLAGSLVPGFTITHFTGALYLCLAIFVVWLFTK